MKGAQHAPLSNFQQKQMKIILMGLILRYYITQQKE